MMQMLRTARKETLLKEYMGKESISTKRIVKGVFL